MNHHFDREKFTRGVGLAVLATILPLSVGASTVAYFRFEEGSDGSGSLGPVPGGQDVVVDSAGNDDPLRAFNDFNAPIYVADVPLAVIPQTGAPNLRSLDFVSNDDIYTAVSGPLVTTNFTDITIEAFVSFDTITGFQTIVGRDDSGNPGQGVGPQSLLYFQKGSQGFRVELVTSSNTLVEVNSTVLPAIGVWNHLAAVGNATTGTLELFLNGNSLGSSTGYTGLFSPEPNTIWTIGRGQFNGNIGDFVDGRIDEVRISSSALTPAEFLNVPEPSTAITLMGGMLGMFAFRRRRQPN